MKSLSAYQKRCLRTMGIPLWELRDQSGETVQQAVKATEAVPVHVEEAPAETAQAAPLQSQWSSLQQQVRDCRACALHQSRTQTVFGVGNQDADWLVIGEAPGAEEDRQGEPFVGRAGQLLNAMLSALGLRRQDVYIANILKCRPPNNRDPQGEEVEACESFLQNQIELIQPKIILAVGRIAAQNLLKTGERIGALRGRKFFYGDRQIPVVVTYHPAYLLRSPKEKRKAWSDLLLAQDTVLRELTSE